MKKHLITLAKITISVAILACLFFLATRKDGGEAFFRMLAQEKRWGLLAASWGVATVAIVLTMIRWCYLVRAVKIAFPMRDAMRIGFLGYLFNLAPMGIVGGDLLKAVMLARERPGNRAKAVASVVVDRIIGLYVLFLVATAGIFLTPYWTSPIAGIHLICQLVLVATAVSTAGIGMVLLTGVLDARWVMAFTRLPRVGPAIGGLVDAMRLYRSNRRVLLLNCLLTVPVHVLLAISGYLLARGFRFEAVPFRDFFAIYPVSSIASTIPLPAGPFESGIVFLYAARLARPPLEGLIVALGLRLTSLLVAPVGLAYYIRGRGEVGEVMHEADSRA